MVKYTKHIISFTWQYLFFILIWCGFLGSYDLLAVTSGIALVFAVSFLFGFSNQKINLIRLIILIGYVLYQLVESSYFVILDIFKQSNIDKYIIKTVDIPNISDTQKVVLANVISLTPGTLTIDVTENTIEIHDMFSFKETCVSVDIVNVLIPMIVKAFPC